MRRRRAPGKDSALIAAPARAINRVPATRTGGRHDQSNDVDRRSDLRPRANRARGLGRAHLGRVTSIDRTASRPAVLLGLDMGNKRNERLQRLNWDSAARTLRRHDLGRKAAEAEKFTQAEWERLLSPWMKGLPAGNRIRSLEDWDCRLRTSDPGRRRMDLIRHLFALYRVPAFLEKVWQTDAKGEHPAFLRIFYPWYIAVAQGRSLYSTCSHGILTRRECHVFLGAPDWLEPAHAVWWARARCEGGSDSACRAVASAFERKDIRSPFWAATARYFARNPVARRELTDLLDWVADEHTRSRTFTLSGRSLAAVRKRSEEWHRANTRAKDLGSLAWQGLLLEDWTVGGGSAEKRNVFEWRVQEIRSGRRLADEGRRMRHCVSSYRDRCRSGSVAIFSMTISRPFDGVNDKPALTIEVDVSRRRVVQARGYANRAARSEEAAVLKQWAEWARIDASLRNRW
jgi:hypothetical protein